ncbi:AcrR family transcriptional regulator [Kutzneria viridogrisea]|nr:TetR/AcrR family transcriptional regulator [Kutzneria albida]MBA8923219.1 AcrR family transcriptional regulator [Kutzneria viridogrisea]
MRSDAEQNRTRILEVARTALRASSAASLQSIAKAAGVGQGTLYRHFPNREALLLAVYRHDLGELIDAAPALLDQHPPFEALRHWLHRLALYGRIKHGLADALQAATRADLASEHYGPVIAVITLLLESCKQAGEMRTDVDAEELLLLVSFLWRAEADEDWDARSRHLLTLVMDGLRPQHQHSGS